MGIPSGSIDIKTRCSKHGRLPASGPVQTTSTDCESWWTRSDARVSHPHRRASSSAISTRCCIDPLWRRPKYFTFRGSEADQGWLYLGSKRICWS